MTTSKFNFDSFFYAIFVFLISTLGSLAFLVKLFSEGRNEVLAFLIIIILFVCSLLFINSFKILKIKDKELKYYRLFRPTGKTIYFDDFIGFIQYRERTAYGDIKTIHLVNKERFTSFKINLSNYKNGEKIRNAIPLKEIKKQNLNFWQYLKLISIGRIRIYSVN